LTHEFTSEESVFIVSQTLECDSVEAGCGMGVMRVNRGLPGRCLRAHGRHAGSLPCAKVDPEYQNLLPSPKFELKQYYTSDSFDKVAAYYKKLGALQGTESFIETKTRRRITFREKPHDKNATTIEWSNESGEDKTKTFILVDSAK
jgi:hypothetical protein